MDISLHSTLFFTPGEACSWALSRFKRDCLSNIWGNGIYPEFIKFVRVIVTDHSSFQECTKNGLFTSKKETDFFRGCKFFHLLNMDNSISLYEQIHPTEFSVLAANLFHSRVDYQLSTTSTYRIGVTALSYPITITYYTVNNQLRVMQETSSDGIIRLERICRHMKDHTFNNVGTIKNFFHSILPSPGSTGLWCQSVLVWQRLKCILKRCAYVLILINNHSFPLTLLWSFFVQNSATKSFFTNMICLSVCTLFCKLFGIVLH